MGDLLSLIDATSSKHLVWKSPNMGDFDFLGFEDLCASWVTFEFLHYFDQASPKLVN